jgi:hypothetical protein
MPYENNFSVTNEVNEIIYLVVNGERPWVGPRFSVAPSVISQHTVFALQMASQ